MPWEDFIIKLVLSIIAAFFLYQFISSAVESGVKAGNKELVITIKESTSKICEEIRKVRESNEKD